MEGQVWLGLKTDVDNADASSMSHDIEQPEPPATSTPAGWYPDAADETKVRYWDGVRWTDQVQARPPLAASRPQHGWRALFATRQRTIAVAVVAALVVAGAGTGIVLSASRGGNAAASAAYDACVNPKGAPILKLDGSSVRIEIKGDAAQKIAGSDEEVKSLTSGDTSGNLDGLMVGLELITTTDCLVKETGYPGTSDQLKNGDSWDGWSYSIDQGAGSEETQTFTAH